MSAKEKVDYESSMKELKIYCDNFKKKHGPMRAYPRKTPFDPNVHFETTSILGPKSEKTDKTSSSCSSKSSAERNKLSSNPLKRKLILSDFLFQNV